MKKLLPRSSPRQPDQLTFSPTREDTMIDTRIIAAVSHALK